MTWVVYVGPFGAVDIAETRQRATKGVPVDVASDVAARLLSQSIWDPSSPGAGGTVTVRSRGLTLRVTAATLNGGAVTLYTDGAASVPLALPVVISADTTWYLAVGTTGTLTLAVELSSGTPLDAVSGLVRNGKDLVLLPWPTDLQIVLAATSSGGSVLDGGTP